MTIALKKDDYHLATEWPSVDDWITELESGRWGQATGNLRLTRDWWEDSDKDARLAADTPVGYCCLGVGCMIAFGEVPDHSDEELSFWVEDFDHWFDGTWSWDENGDRVAPQEDQIYVPAGHYLETPVSRRSRTSAPIITNLMGLLIAANDNYFDGKFTAVVQILREYRDGVRDWVEVPSTINTPGGFEPSV